MNKLKCYAVFFYKGVSGLVVTSKQSKALKSVLNKFGFKSPKDYTSSLPGKYSKDSVHTTILRYEALSNRNNKHLPPCQTHNWSTAVEFGGSVWSIEDYQHTCLGDECGSCCVTSPTIEEFKKYSKTQTDVPFRGGVALSDEPDSELWFCSDWSEDM